MYDCLIIGAGPIALTLARTLELRGLTFSLCGELPRERPNSPDLRTAALFDGSIRLLERLGVWPHIASAAAPLDGIRIVDATGRLLRAPEQIFAAADIGEQRLGYNIPNPTLVAALRTALDANHRPSPASALESAPESAPESANEVNLSTQVRHVVPAPGHVAMTLADGSTRYGRMAVGADGRASMTRTAAGISVSSWQHDQAAITAHFEHALPNQAISTEIHTQSGPCTVVPMAAHKASLVWMMRPAAATQLAATSDAAFTTALEQRLDGLLGPIQRVSARRVFPLSTLIAERFAANRIALVGESAHAFPPIGAQGLNLGLRDVACLADQLADAKANGQDIGGDAVLNAYSNLRSTDIKARTYGVEAFNASLSSHAAGLIRGAVLHATNASSDFKGFLMRRGLQPVGDWPSLMR